MKKIYKIINILLYLVREVTTTHQGGIRCLKPKCSDCRHKGRLCYGGDTSRKIISDQIDELTLDDQINLFKRKLY